MQDEPSLDAESPFPVALAIDLADPEVARARAAIASRLLGTPEAPSTIGRYMVIERLGAGGMGIVYTAYDPGLDRKVALKLLFGQRSGEIERQRLVREAKAMAKLSHPNVVHVYDAGEHDGRVFVAMELVRGQTLRAWARASSRPAREVVAMCVQAGRGLAAAHAAGIIHRDFKPDNVIIGEDGRARVLDFGLARHVAEDEDTWPHGPVAAAPRRASGTSATRTGAVVGTPGYVAPELLRGDAPDVLSDQFSFCATVWEALTGALPYPRELYTAPDADWRIAAPPRGSMPRWVERVLRRGLGERGRYPRLDELLGELRRDPARQRLRIAASVAVLASIGGAFAIGLRARDKAASAEPCSGGEQVLASAWTDADRDAAIARITDVGTPYAGVLAPRLQTQLGGYASAWIEQHREVCLAHQRGEQSAELLDLRMTCLQRSKRALVTLGRLMREATDADLTGIASAASSLPAPELCEDVEALAAGMTPPPPEARPIAERLEEAKTLALAGREGDANALVEAVIVDARALGHGPLLAEALVAQGVVLNELVGRADAVSPLREAVDVAMRSGADELAIDAWGRQAWAVATDATSTPEQFPDGRELIVALAERRPKSATAAGLYLNLGEVERAANNHDAAREMYMRVVTIASELADPRIGRVHAQALVGLAELEPDPTIRLRMGERAIALMAEAAGAEHERTLWMRRTQALYFPEADDALEALVSACDDMRRFHGKDSEDPDTCWKLPALLAELVGDDARSLAATREWARLAIVRSRPLASGYLALREGDAATAERSFTQIVAKLESRPARPWWVELELGEAELALGRAKRALGRPEADETIARGVMRQGGRGKWLSPKHAWLLRHAKAVQAHEVGSR